MVIAKDIMSSEVVTVAPDLPVEDLARLLWKNKIGGAPVLEHGKILGVVTESDLIDQAKYVHIPTVVSILDSFLFLENPQSLDQEIKKMAGRQVNDIFSREVILVEPDATIGEMATIMSEKKVHTLPVVEDGKLIGVVGKGDLIRAMSNGL